MSQNIFKFIIGRLYNQKKPFFNAKKLVFSYFKIQFFFTDFVEN